MAQAALERREAEEATLAVASFAFLERPGQLHPYVFGSAKKSAMNALARIKLLHTVIWAFLAGSVLALPLTALLNRLGWAMILTVIILGECGVLAFNKGRCPLTGLAGRFTNDRGDNFDIYLPNWLARHNKAIFGSLFVVNELFVLWCRMK